MPYQRIQRQYHHYAKLAFGLNLENERGIDGFFVEVLAKYSAIKDLLQDLPDFKYHFCKNIPKYKFILVIYTKII